MKSSAVYEASLRKFVLRFETMIWPSMRFDISLQNLKKPLVDIFSPQTDVMYKKHKRMVYTHPYLLARFCKVNLSNAKNSAWFVFQEFVFQA